jgi:hypothetical protein
MQFATVVGENIIVVVAAAVMTTVAVTVITTTNTSIITDVTAQSLIAVKSCYVFFRDAMPSTVLSLW